MHIEPEIYSQSMSLYKSVSSPFRLRQTYNEACGHLFQLWQIKDKVIQHVTHSKKEFSNFIKSQEATQASVTKSYKPKLIRGHHTWHIQSHTLHAHKTEPQSFRATVAVTGENNRDWRSWGQDTDINIVLVLWELGPLPAETGQNRHQISERG